VSYERQLDLLVTTLVSIVVFVGCIFYGALPLSISICVAILVFLIGLVLGRRVADILHAFFG
jgi:hypothetical protein